MNWKSNKLTYRSPFTGNEVFTTENMGSIVDRFFSRGEEATPFESLFDSVFSGVEPFKSAAYPKVNIIDNKDHILIEAELAGLTKNDVEVKVENGILTIMGHKREAEEKTEKNYLHRELKHSSFKRQFHLGEFLDESKVAASINNGVLSVTVGKFDVDAAPKEAKKIEIK